MHTNVHDTYVIEEDTCMIIHYCIGKYITSL